MVSSSSSSSSPLPLLLLLLLLALTPTLLLVTILLLTTTLLLHRRRRRRRLPLLLLHHLPRSPHLLSQQPLQPPLILHPTHHHTRLAERWVGGLTIGMCQRGGWKRRRARGTLPTGEGVGGRVVGGWVGGGGSFNCGENPLSLELFSAAGHVCKDAGFVEFIPDVEEGFVCWVGGWVGGWVDRKVEEDEAVGMSYCQLGLGGWVGRRSERMNG